ncbi:inositol monophosphatase family protein [Halomonas sp. 328]|uniref:inositol monophosphatase family protein n=1 Tax=Halomonas sp. 328 TaxID=2776704 RepID=UPI0018A79757|nr:inositol monophosphatase family protein [Halomonas sp. 328]MBF8224110.1 inositol monophosphatase [Halomonas sp. 328]
MTLPTPLIDTLKLAARAAGELLREGYQGGSPIALEHKGPSDFVTHYDRAAERAIIETIRRAHPGVGFLGEETGASPAEGTGPTVIIDPLDSTNNFLHRLPHFSVSLAVREGDTLTHGVVYQPLLDEMLWAVRGRGAFLNERPLALPPARPLTEMLVATCLPYHAKGDCATSLAQLAALMPRVAGLRVPGSAALEVAYVALGRADAFFSQGARLDLWDIAAGLVIAREAGCAVSDLAGEPSLAEWQSLLVAHPERHGELRRLLNEAP